MAIKKSMMRGLRQREAVKDLSELPWGGHTVKRVRSQGEYVAALNDAWSHERYTVIVLDKPGLRISMPVIQGKTKAKEIIHYGAHGDQTEGIIGDRTGQIMGLFGSNNFGFYNLYADGQEGRYQKGVIMGSANGDKDGRHAPVKNFWFSHFEVFGVREQLMMFSDDSVGLNLFEVDLHHNGWNSDTFAEGFYMGKGGDSTRSAREISAVGLCVYDIDGGEAVDMKVSTVGFRMSWFDIENTLQNYSGAVTLCIDNSDGGHGEDNDWRIENGIITHARTAQHGVSGVQVGSGGHMSRVFIDNIPHGHGVQTLRQAVGPNKTLTMDEVYIGRAARGSVSTNQSTLGDKSQARSPMTIDATNVYTMDGAGNTRTIGDIGQMEEAWKDAIRRVQNQDPPPVTPPPVTPPPVTPPPVTPPPVDPPPVIKDPPPIEKEIEVEVKVGARITYDTTELRLEAARLTKMADQLDAANEELNL